MRFGKQLESTLIPEWKPYYINYKLHKKTLSRIQEALKSANVIPTEDDTARPSVDGRFLGDLLREMQKVEAFYIERENESIKRFAELQKELLSLRSSQTGKLRVGKLYTARTENLRKSYRDFYHSLIMLQSFASLNAQGFVKLAKKHDKLIPFKISGMLKERLHVHAFHNTKHLIQLMSTTENVFTEYFASGDRHLAMREIRVEQKQVGRWLLFRLGVYCGLVFPGLYTVLRLFVAYPWLDGLFEGPAIVAVYRGMALLILALLFVGINIEIWVRSKINFLFVFELDPRTQPSGLAEFEAAAFFAVLWLGSLYGYVVGVREGDLFWGIPPWVYPPAFCIIVLVCLFIPLNIFGRSLRYWVIVRIFQSFTAPFHSVHFRDFFVADQLNSLVVLLYDFVYIGCYYTADFWWGTEKCSAVNLYIRGALACWPSWCRFWQCIRRFRDAGDHKNLHLLNAVKYCSTVLLVVFSILYYRFGHIALFVCWIAFAIISTVFVWLWDVTQDWGIIQLRPFRLFPRPLQYPSKVPYVIGLIANLFLRVGWLLVLSPFPGIVNWELWLGLFGLGELVRRFMWNLFRMENEFLMNCEQFRVHIQVPNYINLEEIEEMKEQEAEYDRDQEEESGDEDDEKGVDAPSSATSQRRLDDMSRIDRTERSPSYRSTPNLHLPRIQSALSVSEQRLSPAPLARRNSMTSQRRDSFILQRTNSSILPLVSMDPDSLSTPMSYLTDNAAGVIELTPVSEREDARRRESRHRKMSMDRRPQMSELSRLSVLAASMADLTHSVEVSQERARVSFSAARRRTSMMNSPSATMLENLRAVEESMMPVRMVASAEEGRLSMAPLDVSSNYADLESGKQKSSCCVQ